MHIENLYKNTDILFFKQCYALEKIHGTSAHLTFKENRLTFFSGGAKHENFLKIFDIDRLTSLFKNWFEDTNVIIFGEAYGGKQQGMSKTYGDRLKFIVFDVKIDGKWLSVPNAEDVASKLGLEFVSWHLIPATVEDINKERDLPSEQAKRNGIKEEKMREGVVLRPLIELTKNNGERIISKHKREEFSETKTKREVNPEKLKILRNANEIAEEWVTPMRLTHVLDKFDGKQTIENTGEVIKDMIDDIYREAEGEIIKNAYVKKAIARKTALLFKKKISKLEK